MEFKPCTKCGKTYPATVEFFYRQSASPDGLQWWCKACAAGDDRAYRAIHKVEIADRRTARKEDRAAYDRAYCEAHKEHIAAYGRAYSESHKEEKAAYRRAHQAERATANRLWRQQNRAHINEVARQRLQTNPMLHLRARIASDISMSLHGYKAGRHWETLVHYTLDDLRQHLEARFQVGMSWENYGCGGWIIDHVKPQNAFSFASPDDREFKECWALENLQPMWAKDNLAKGTKESALLVTDQRSRRR